MEMIDLSRLEPQETLNHTSKGNQLKWKCYGYWYKADHMGYEGLAETIVSALLGKSTVKYPFVAYEYSQIKYKDRVYSGCKSVDFLADGYDLIPLEKLYRKFTGGRENPYWYLPKETSRYQIGGIAHRYCPQRCIERQYYWCGDLRLGRTHQSPTLRSDIARTLVAQLFVQQSLLEILSDP